jgi:PRTRC genetic system protein F
MNSIAIERPAPKAHGTFVLPLISPAVPMVIGGEVIAHQSLAMFSLAAEKFGFDLPGGDLTSLESIIQLQLQNWLEKQITDNARICLNGQPSVVATSEEITFYMNAVSNLELFHLKPIIDAIEAKAPGLGWYVVDVIERSSGRGITVYGPSAMAHHSVSYFNGAESDADFVKEMQAMEGHEDPSEEDMAELVEQAREDHAFLPSDVLASVDGHSHLLGWATPGSKLVKRKWLTKKQAVLALKASDLPEDMRNCVTDAIALDRLYSKDKGAYCWDGSDEVEPIGAACFVAWDDASILMELIGHYEEDTYNSGMAHECLCRFNVNTGATPGEFKNMARLMRAYFDQWNALGNLLMHFSESKGKNDA